MTETIIHPDKTDPAFYVWETNYESVWGVPENPFFVVRNGEMRINYTLPSGDTEVIRYTDNLEKLGIETDSQLQEAEQSEKLVFINNAWFEVWSAKDTDYFSDPIFDVVEAIQKAKDLKVEFPNGVITD